MNFALNDTQRQILDLAERVFADAATPGRLRELQHEGYFDPDLWKTLASTGLLGLATAESSDGLGLDFETLAVLLEQAGRFVAPAPLVPVLVTAGLALQRNAPDVAARLLPGVISGDSLITAALCEAGNDDTLTPATRAEQVADGWRLHGTKTGVPVLDQAPGALWLTAATARGLGVFLVTMPAANADVQPQTWTTGEHTGRLRLEGTPAQLLAIGDAAHRFVEDALTLTRAALAALAVGLCAEMTRLAATYTSERIVFGRAAATFQAVSHQVADCHIDTECLRSAALLAANDIANASPTAARSALVAKIWASEALHRVSHGTQQVHGGIGIDRDYPLFRYALFAKSVELAAGAAEPLLEELGQAIAGE